MAVLAGLLVLTVIVINVIPGEKYKPLIRKLHINDTRFALLDGESGKNINLSSDKVHMGSVEGRLDIDINGKYNEIPLAFTGGLDNDKFFVVNQPTAVKLDGHLGDAKPALRGTAGPFHPTFDLDITTAVNTDSVAVFSPLRGRELPDIGPLAVSVKLKGKEGKHLAATATGGLSLAAGILWGKVRANADVCGEILKKLKDDE